MRTRSKVAEVAVLGFVDIAQRSMGGEAKGNCYGEVMVCGGRRWEERKVKVSVR